MQGTEIDHLQVTLLILLTLVAALAVMARRLQVPYPIVLVVGGLLLGFVPHIPRPSLDPSVVFLIFLPPLLFSSSFHLSWSEFRKSLTSIILLAFGLVTFTIVGVALAARFLLPGFDWPLGLVLGAVVATTDPIAATATARKLGLPRALSELIESESLLNDGSGLLALRFTSAMLVTGITPSPAQGALELLYLVSAAIAIGLLAGFLARKIQSHISDSPVEITLSIVLPYVTYLAAESAHCSGVLATIACGLYLGRHRSTVYSLDARIDSTAFWNTLDFILNGLVFLLLGLQLPGVLADVSVLGARTLWTSALLLVAFVIGLRLLWVLPGAWLAYLIRTKVLHQRCDPPDPREVLLIGWAGMRGVLALAAAISLPATIHGGAAFPQRSVIIFLTFCVILATLVGQGLTLPGLIRGLGLAGFSESKEEEAFAQKRMARVAILYLEQRSKKMPENQEVILRLSSHYRRQLELLGGAAEEPQMRSEARVQRELSRQIRHAQREEALRLRREGRIHDEVLRKIERGLDLVQSQLGPDDV